MAEEVLKQQINLLDARFRSEDIKFSVTQILVIGVLALAGLQAFYGYSLYEVSSLKKENKNLESLHAGNLKQLETLGARLKPLETDPRLDEELKIKLEEKQRKERILALLSGKVFGNTTGFSGHLEGIARQTPSGIWIKDVTIGGGGTRLGISGSTIKPELVPVMLQNLSREAAFSGTDFSSFTMEREKEEASVVDFAIRTKPGDSK